MLVVTPRPAPTESLMGFALRLTEANGYPSISYVVDSLSGHLYRQTPGRLNALPLLEMVGISSEEADRLTLRPMEKSKAYIRIHGNDLPSYEVNVRNPKICPKCLAENGNCEAFWDLTQAVACPLHRIMLIDRCSECLLPLKWHRSKVVQCKCGADLRNQPISPASPPLCKIMEVMRHLVYRDALLSPFPETMRHLAHLDIRRLCKLLWVMSGALHQRQGGESLPKSRRRYLAELERIARAFEHWPSGFQVFLEEMYAAELDAATRLPRFRQLFSWLTIRLIKNDGVDDEVYAFLEEQVYRFGARYWTRGAMCRDGAASSLFPDTMPWGTISEAADILGFHMTTMKRRIESGEIKVRQISEKKMRGMVVDLDWARSQVLSRFPTVRIRMAAKQLKVSIETVRALRENGTYVTSHRPMYPDGFAREDISVLAEKFEKLTVGKVCVRCKEATTLQRVFIRHRAAPMEKANMLAWLLANPDRVIGCKSAKAGITQAQISSEDAEQFFRSVGNREVYVNEREAQRQLSVQSWIITWLRNEGFLECTKHIGRMMVRKESLEQFERTFEVLKLIADRVGKSAALAYRRVDLSGVCHVKAGPNGRTVLFIHRSDVDKVEKMLSAIAVKRLRPRSSDCCDVITH